jgi:1,4-alpha-glucan branching enzyme
VIGTFNGWSPDQSPMRRLESGVWEIVLSLPPGKHSYRFLVNNRVQVVDPMSRTLEPDGFGGENSILFVE